MSKKNKIKIINLLVVLMLLFCGYLCVNMYNKPPLDINKKNTELSISSKKLISTFSANEISANLKYVEKVIVVKGTIKKITYLNERYTILLQGENEFSHIICDMSTSEIESIKKLKAGENVNVKGICKGYLMDVVMLNCIIVNK